MAYVYDFDHPHRLRPVELAALVGGKAANLAVMTAELGLPVPPGFTVTTEACRAYLAGGWPVGLDEELRAHMVRVEALVGRRFGDAQDPLLVSVRSGAPVSMPGMMDTILDLGMTPPCVPAMAAKTGSDEFARDCERRLQTMYRDIVGEDVPNDPWAQLRGAVEAVFRSWNSDRARAYRAKEGIGDDLGTGVTVQAMVFGNRGPRSGTGVLFTRNPATGEPVLYGDVMFQAQGEDVVAGTHRTEPVAVLDERLPEVWRELRDYASRLERHYRDLCDIEFTIEEAKLWMLQVRVGKRSPLAALRIARDMAEDPEFPLTRAEAVERVAQILADPPTIVTERSAEAPPLARGLPASPGVASGEIAVTPDGAVAAADAGRTVILVRAETSPDDVHGMARSAGVLTSTGGLASHAAVVARGWAIPAVVGAADVTIGDGTIGIGRRQFAVGDVITIDGGTGEVFEGAIGGERRIAPEAVTLLDWARELGIEVRAHEEGTTVEAQATSTRQRTPEDALRALGIKGFATPAALADALLSTADVVDPLIEQLIGAGLAETSAGSLRLTVDGKLACHELIEADAQRWGEEDASDALDTFHGLDLRMKDTVTAWQMRDTGGEPVINDHSDADYDASVLDGLAALHADAGPWLAGLIDHCGRFGDYILRLERALAQARAGDARFVASPRVDSYHGVWFELHEELIRLAGRRRSDEVAAGRA